MLCKEVADTEEKMRDGAKARTERWPRQSCKNKATVDSAGHGSKRGREKEMPAALQDMNAVALLQA